MPQPDLFGPIDRRTFLRGTTGGAAALALGALLPAGCGGYEPITGLRTFTAKEHAVVEALATAFVAPAGDMPTVRELGLARYLDGYLAPEPAAVLTQLKRALLLLEYGGLWYGPEHRRLTRMSGPAQTAYLRGWLESDSPFRRQVAQTFRRACTNAYYTDERTWAGIGYDGPWVS